MYVRLPEDLLARVDARVEELKAQGGLFTGVSRSDVIREAVEAGMDSIEQRAKGKAKK